MKPRSISALSQKKVVAFDQETGNIWSSCCIWSWVKTSSGLWLETSSSFSSIQSSPLPCLGRWTSAHLPMQVVLGGWRGHFGGLWAWQEGHIRFRQVQLEATPFRVGRRGPYRCDDQLPWAYKTMYWGGSLGSSMFQPCHASKLSCPFPWSSLTHTLALVSGNHFFDKPALAFDPMFGCCHLICP